MKIVIRSRYFQSFLVCWQSFILFYPERIKDVIVQIQKDPKEVLFEEAAKYYGFKTKYIDPVNRSKVKNNEWALMIYESLNYDEDVVSLDDDIVYINSGLFTFLDNLHIKTKSNIIGYKYRLESGKNILHSHIISKRRIQISKDDFLSLDDVRNKYEGVDTGLIGDLYSKNISYIEDYIITEKKNPNKCFYMNPYYIHIGNASCAFNAINNNYLRSH